MQKILLLVCVILYACIYKKHHADKELSNKPFGLIDEQTAKQKKAIYKFSGEILKTKNSIGQQNDIVYNTGSWNIKNCTGYKFIDSERR
jgi:hypothetical protein